VQKKKRRLTCRGPSSGRPLSGWRKTIGCKKGQRRRRRRKRERGEKSEEISRSLPRTAAERDLTRRTEVVPILKRGGTPRSGTDAFEKERGRAGTARVRQGKGAIKVHESRLVRCHKSRADLGEETEWGPRDKFCSTRKSSRKDCRGECRNVVVYKTRKGYLRTVKRGEREEELFLFLVVGNKQSNGCVS